jgi:anti-anti-sigma factor
VASVPEFQIDMLQSGSATTIKLAGELDSATHGQLLEHFERAAGPAGNLVLPAGNLVLDLENVSFIDSAGMRAIIVIEQEARDRGMSLTVIPPPEPLTELLSLTGVSDQAALTSRDGAAAVPTQFIDRVELELPRHPTSPGRARAELRQFLRGRRSKNDAATATLLISELVTNAVLHAGETSAGSIALRITTYADRLRVEVSDSGPGFDLEQLPPRPHATGGHGLLVVDGLASRWGTDRAHDDGRSRFRVWFELDGGAGDEAMAGAKGPARNGP